jgi:hypothetical protein
MYYQALQAEYTEGLLARQVSQLGLQRVQLTVKHVCSCACSSVLACMYPLVVLLSMQA